MSRPSGTEQKAELLADGSIADPVATRKILRGTLAGTIVEWYDFSIYGFLAVVLATHFFPADDPTVALLSAYLSYSVAYVVRPIAGAVIGRIADRVGRKNVLAWMILLMGGSTFVVGLVPSYEAIGVAAPILVLLLRLVQGIGASGEWSLGATYLLESTPRRRWSVMGSYLGAAYFIALILGAGLAAALAAVMGPAFSDWGWRLLFLMAAPMTLVGQYIRRQLDESPEFRQLKEASENAAVPQLPLAEALRLHWRPLLAYVGALAQQRVAQFALSTFVVAALLDAGLGFALALLLTALTYLISVPLVLIGGHIGSRYGLITPLVISVAALTLSAVPTFLVIEGGSFWAILAIQVVFSFGVVVGMGPGAALMVDLFPAEVRGVASGLSYNLGTVVFGSTAPLVATLLFDVTGHNTAFAWYVVIMAALALPSLLYCSWLLASRNAMTTEVAL